MVIISVVTTAVLMNTFIIQAEVSLKIELKVKSSKLNIFKVLILRRDKKVICQHANDNWITAPPRAAGTVEWRILKILS